MKNEHEALSESTHHMLEKSGGPQSIEWYSPGQTRVFEVEGVRIAVRFVGRKGRRGRITITAPSGATFCTLESNESSPTSLESQP